jgi:RHS repeat-associated protein
MHDRIARLFIVFALSLVGLATAQSAKATLPSGWSDSDVGSVGTAGSASYSNGAFTVNGAGDGLFGTSDGLNFAYQPISGDCTIVARLVTSGTSSDPQVGVMIRETLAANSAEASVVYNDRGQPSYFYFFHRASTGASPSYVNSSPQYLAYWIKLVRSGNSFSAYTSLNGLSWSQLGTTQLLTMGQNAYAGISVDSRDTSVLATATFDNVSITTSTITPPAITSVSATTGNSGTQVALTGTGFGSTQSSSLALLNGTALTVNSWADTSIQVTLPTGVTSGPLSVAIAPTMNASNPIPFEVTANPLPTGWLNQDVGLTGVIGTATYSNNQFTVVAAGAGIDNGNDTTTDGFHFVYQPLSGDGTLIVRLASVTGSGSQAGIMIRETLASNATNDFLWYYSGNPNQIVDTDRLNPGASTSSASNNVQGLNAPCWLKLVRQGNFISPYTSSDGVNWNSMANPLPFTMQSNVYIGLGVTDRNLTSTVTAVFDNISISSASTSAPTINSLSASTGVAGAQINIAGTNFGSSQGNSQVYLNGTAATVNSWAAGAITITIPNGATSGPLVVSVAPGMDDSNAVSFAVTSTPLLTGWLDSDVGLVGRAGSASYSGGTFTVNGAGNSIGGTADGFHFVYQPMTTNGTIIARLTASGSNYAQAGVMIRETLTGASADFFPYAEYVPSYGYFNYLDYRIGANASTSQQGGQAITLPIWFKAVRAANVFTAYTSTDGMIWTPYGTPQTIATAQTVYMGFGVSSGNTNLLAAATFDNVSLSGGASLPNPVVTSLNPTSGVTGSTVQIVGSGFGTTQGTSPASVVSFNGTPATVNSWSDGLISVVVPDTAATGPVSAVVGNITGSGPPFTVSFKAQLTDSLGNVSNYTSQVIGSRWSLLNAQGSGCSTCSNRTNQQYTYDGNANPLFITDALGNISKKSYDASKNLAALTVPINANTTATTTYTYNSMGEVLTATDALGQTTTNTYDTHGNLLTTQTPSPDGSTAGSITQFTYNTLGQLVTITDPLNNITTLTYTPVGLINTVKDAQNNVTTYGYDSRGNRTTVTDALSHQTTFTYDTGNRLTKITYPDTTTVQIGYDYRGRRTSVTDQNNKTTTYAYDDADRLTTVTDAATNVTTYGYDTESNLTSIKDANNNTTTFTYDPYGRVTKTTFPSGLYETYAYDANNNLTTKTDRKNQTITYTYDQMNRLTQKTYPDSTGVGYTYDLASRLTQVFDVTGTYAFTFDNMGRLHTTSTNYTFLSRSLNTSYAYDKASNRTGFTDPESGSTTYAYDTLNRLQTLTPPSAFTTGSFGFSYDVLNRRTQMTRPNSVTTNYTYDNLSRLLTVLHQLSGSTIDGASYAVDNAGNRKTKTDNRTGTASNYGYDAIYELNSVTQGVNTTESYTYDPVGNRLSNLAGSGWTYNSSNQLGSRTGDSYTYDPNGNTTSKTDSAGMTTYAWDYENRLTSVTLPGQGGNVSYAYDPFGRRIKKASSAGTSIYAYDYGNVIEETNAAGGAVARYSQGLSIDEHLAMLRSSTTSYYEQDGLGTVTSLSNAGGTLAQTYTFDSFGNQTASSGSLTNSFQYTGREFDSEIGLYYNRARYYDPAAGRFLAEDPLGYGGDGSNFYAYVGNSPTGFTDIFGLKMEAAKSGLCEISNKKFSGPCRKFLEKLANQGGISVDALVSQLQATASDAQNYVYDGPSSTVPLDANKFPGAASPGVNTVGQHFADKTGEAGLSQFNGSAIFLSGDWGSGVLTGILSAYAKADGSATSYGLGILTHELLHKRSVGGGFSHSNMEAALDAAGAPGRILGQEDIASRIAQLCFK